ncbi:MAG: 2-C-methyl-D-erythritol 4-phosphate cytidylyltransferase [Candidatus Eremiobacteraeota bacterium]|nr:2-C-methyl-D-erythritol 4-phosphate cytidylyltransferase [Candidatus Eremiobacteraeota bacterium]
MTWAAVIVAAGRGARLGAPKQLLDLAGTPMVGWSVRAFASMDEIAMLVVVTEPESIEPIQALCAQLACRKRWSVVRGGATRQESVYEGLRNVSEGCDSVLVHDGARPLVSVDDVRGGMREVRVGRAALLATPVVDTIKRVDAESLRVEKTLDRGTLWAAQTPQFARTAELRAAHEAARSQGVEATDDAALLERAGVAVIVVPSSSENFKVTLPADVARARVILSKDGLA